MSRVRYSIVANFSYYAGVNPSVPMLTPRRWSSASRSRWLGRSMSRPSTLRIPPLNVVLSACVCGVSIHLYILSYRLVPPTAFTSKGVRYANAWPAVHVIDLEVGFTTRHIEGDVEQLTRKLATLKPCLEVCGRASVIPASNLTQHGLFMGINASCFGDIWILQAVHTIRFGLTAVTSGAIIDPLYKLKRFRL